MRQVYLLRLQWVTNVVMCLLSSAKSIWWNPYFRSTLFNTVLPFKSWRTSSTVGMGWHSLVTPWLVRLMSTQMLTSPQQQVGRPNWLVPLVLLLWSHKPATHLTFSPLSPHTKWTGCATGFTEVSTLVVLQETHPIKQFLVFIPYVLICGLNLNTVHRMDGSNT